MTSPDARVELKINGTWTAVAGDVQDDDGIRYSWGRRGEGSRTDASSASFTLRNEDGKYSSRNPLSPYFGLLGRNTPVRITHGGANVALVVPSGAAGSAETADHASLDIVGDIDVRADLTPAQWGGPTASGTGWEVMGKWAGITQDSWALHISDSGKVGLRWSANGIITLSQISTRPVPFAPGQRGAIRATLDVDNGASGHTLVFYVASTLAGPWTQLGDPVVVASTTSIFSSTATLQVGDVVALSLTDIHREIHAVEVRSGIGGSVVANPNFAAQASGTTSFTDGAGRSWSLRSEAAITSRRTRAVLEASEWVPRWSSGGRDVTTPIEASGVLRRLGVGDKPLASALRRRLPTAEPIAYWPLEDGSNATQAASPIAGCPPLRVADLSFAQDDSCPGSSSLPTVGDAATMQARVPTTTGLGWTLSMVYQLDSAPAGSSGLLAFTATGTAAHGIVLSFTNPNVVIDFYNASNVLITSTSFSNAGLIGQNTWIRVDFTATYVGPSTDYTANFVTTDGTVQATSTTSLSGVPGIVEDIATAFGTQLSGMAIGHLAVFDSPTVTIWNGAESGYDGEAAGDRLIRLGGEENVPIIVAASEEVATAMGPQRPNSLVSLITEAEDADGGILAEDPDRLGLIYRTRSTLYNQTPKAVLTYSQLVAPLEPTDDDRWLRNDRTVARAKGSSSRAVLTSGALSTAEPPAGVGLYDDSETVNVHADTQLDDVAWWLLHRGTWDEARYPRLRILLHKQTSLIPTVSALRPGDIIRITGLPAWLPPGPLDLMVEGGVEELSALEWVVDLACSPAGMWSVAVADDTVPARVDTDGSKLTSGISSSATSLSITVTAGELWTTAGADFPFDIRIGGEVMTLSAISGASSPQTATVSARSVNGIVKAHLANAAVALAYPSYTSY